jgi:hypothetical protein
MEERMRRAGCLLAAVAGCSAEADPPPAPTTDGDVAPQLKYAGCSLIDTLTWRPDGFSLGDRVEEVEFDNLGWIVVAVVLDNDATEERYVRRPDGQYTEWTRDLQVDGTVDEAEHYTFGDDDLADTRTHLLGDWVADRSTYRNVDGLRMEEDFYVGADDTVDGTIFYHYDDLDRVVEVITDTGPDGTSDQVITVTYLRDTELPTHFAVTGPDVPDYDESYEYDEGDRLIRWLVEDGRFVVDTAYSYLDPDEPHDEIHQETTASGALVETADLLARHDAEGRLLEEVTTHTTYPTEDPEVATLGTSHRQLDWSCP